tara:strand:- start:5186 stop:6637 length:1452 start_codon:yes stop_codon:yes gene_type:complete
MASSYTEANGIELIGAGEQAGTWGTTTNTNLQALDRAANGVVSIALSGTTTTLSTTDGALSNGQYKTLIFTGALGADNTVTIDPNDVQKIYVVVNNTTDSASSGPYSVIMTQGSGGNVTVDNGKAAIIWANGGGDTAKVTDITALLAVSSSANLVSTSNSTSTITGDLEFDVSGDIIFDADGNDIKIQNGAGADEVTITLADDTAFTIATPGDCTIDATGDIVLDADGNDIAIKNGGGGDTATITFADDAAFTLATPGDTTVDSAGDIILDADGANLTIKDGGTTVLDIVMNGATDVTLDAPGDINIDADGGDIVFKDGGTTAGSLDIATADTIKFKAGSTEEMRLTTSGLAIENGLYVGDASTAPTDNEVRAQGDITAFHSSDKRLKENITPITDALEKVSKINGVEFDWTDEHIEKRGGEDGYFVRKHDVGVIAQEVLEVLPEVVREREDNTLAVDYERMVALLIEAVKDLKKEVEELKQK